MKDIKAFLLSFRSELPTLILPHPNSSVIDRQKQAEHTVPSELPSVPNSDSVSSITDVSFASVEETIPDDPIIPSIYLN